MSLYTCIFSITFADSFSRNVGSSYASMDCRRSCDDDDDIAQRLDHWTRGAGSAQGSRNKAGPRLGEGSSDAHLVERAVE